MIDARRREKQRWDNRYQSQEFPRSETPAAILSDVIAVAPDGRALDIATGTGRHAIFLAEHGYVVDAIDFSRVALKQATMTARERGVSVNWIQADLTDFTFPTEHYALITVIGYKDLDLLSTLADALVPGGVLVYEHHLGPAAPATSGPSTDTYRFRQNELLHGALSLRILAYREWSTKESSEHAPRVTLVARKPTDPDTTYMPPP